jgi:outer membrane protein assembly factor BamB
MRKYLLILAAILLAFGSGFAFATNPSNNLFLVNGCNIKTEELTLLWDLNIQGNVLFPPVDAADGTVFVATDKSVAAINSNAGKILWDKAVAGGCKWNVAICSNSSIAVSGAKEVFCLNAKDGSKIWSKVLDSDISAQPVSNGTGILVVIGKTVTCMNVKTGEQTWSKDLPGFAIASPCVYGNNIYMATIEGYNAALNANDGALEWENRTGENPSDALVATEKHVYITNGRSLYAIDRKDGKPIWKFAAKDDSYAPTIVGDTVFYPSKDKTFYSLDGKNCGKGCCLQTPKQLWSLNMTSASVGRIAVSNEHAYMVTTDGWLFIIDAVKGDVVSRHNLGYDLSKTAMLKDQLVIGYGKKLTSYANIPKKFRIYLDKTFIDRDDFRIETGEGAKIIKGKSMVPIKSILDPFGGLFDWNSKTKTMTCYYEGRQLEIKIGSPYAVIDGKTQKIDANPNVTPAIVNGRTMVPARFFATTFMGMNVSWDGQSKSFEITRSGK